MAINTVGNTKEVMREKGTKYTKVFVTNQQCIRKQTSSPLTFNPCTRAIIMTHIYSKGQGRRSLDSKIRVEMD